MRWQFTLPYVWRRLTQRRGRWLLGAGLILVIVISSMTAYLLNTTRRLDAQAAAVDFAGGQISIAKKYYQNGSEQNAILAGPGEAITVRLRYDNTGDSSGIGAQITDNIPTGFAFIPGSLENCYVDTQCINLNNSLHSNNVIQVAPSAGYFGYADNSSSSNLELGRKKYTHFSDCLYTLLGQNAIPYTSFLSHTLPNTFSGTFGAPATATNTLETSPQCGSGNTVSWPLQSLGNDVRANINITGNRYLRLTECVYTLNGENSIPYTTLNQHLLTGGVAGTYGAIQDAANVTDNTPNCGSGSASWSLQNAGNLVKANLDLLGNRYLRLTECVYTLNNKNQIPYSSMLSHTLSGVENGTFGAVQDAANTTNSIPSCGSGSSNWPLQNAGNSVKANVDLLDQNRGYGYIQYQMTATTQTGTYGQNTSLNGSFGNLTAASTQTISVQGIDASNLVCDYVYPNGGTRIVTLSDAELRTDQDFTCNYNLSICPVVYLDINVNGLQDPTEPNIPGQSIELQVEGGTVLKTISTDLNSNNCFSPLASNRLYQVRNVNPVSIYNTTAGNIVSVNFGSEGSETYVKFGYTNGQLTLSVPEAASFTDLSVASTDQLVCTNLANITVGDNRINYPGWELSATVDNFVAINDINTFIAIQNRFTQSPKSITALAGELTGLRQGIVRVTESTSDPVAIMGADSGSGVGSYRMSPDVCLNVPAFSPAKSYRSTLYYTLI